MKNSNRLLIVVLVIFTALANIGCAKKKSSAGSVKNTAPASSTTTDTNNSGASDTDTSASEAGQFCKGTTCTKDGDVEVTSQGQKFCLPKSVCNDCYGYYKGYCYQGTKAYEWYSSHPWN